MLKKRILLTGILTIALASPMPAQAGWPVFDVAKLASLISNLAGRYQPVAQVLSRINQVKTIQGQIEAQGKAVMSGDIKALGKIAGKSLKKESFSSAPALEIEKKAQGGATATEVSDAVWDTYFFPAGSNPSQDEINKKKEARDKLWKKVRSAYVAKAIYFSNSSKPLAEERIKKIEEAMNNSKTMQDAVNANTVAVMANNFEKLNQMTMLVVQMQKDTVERMNNTPYTRYLKPEPPKFDAETVKEMGDIVVKDEADVDLQ